MEVIVSKLLKVIKLSSQIILESGGETYRAEETIKFICKSFNVNEIDSIATPTGVYITISTENTENSTVVRRIKKRSINLDKLHKVNNISRQLTNHLISLDEAIKQLEETRNEITRHNKFSVFYGGISAAFFTLLFGGSFFGFIIALISGIIVTLITKKFEDLQSYQFFSSIIAGIIVSSFAIVGTNLIKIGNYNHIIVGGIMPHLPGLAMTNAIRDTIRGDLISGLARGAEALIVAASLAAGAGVIISLAYTIGLLPIK
ncbi:threonine/serine ThrE exporter family protein [Sedimentibacter sp. MB31-C6]|uniref:threonine/serine ThrE exporter family protein n=1 Tax=Sedimentibacter sp. MB31-C6 TaxID=3109366 RepID=UPI002DDCDD5E|nr:threonine/serine exporter family protein [Sedimentibacter sp. MB36-C1]WSI05023.1 threonine/serine exporter family protein [Sedimentibacter sp. MB36-C1]